MSYEIRHKQAFQSPRPNEPEDELRRPVAPGKRTLTQSLPPCTGRAPVQQKQAPAAAAERAQRAALTAQWMDTALRPDLNAPPVQRKSAGDARGSADSPAPSGSGRPLPEDVQAKMEHAFGADFSTVRIHEGSAAQAMGALAYTQGSNIHFAPGQYQPGSLRGQELLGHELAHVVQQSEGRVRATTQAKGVAVNDDVALEREADEMGARAARGQVASSAHAARSASDRSAIGSRGGDVAQGMFDPWGVLDFMSEDVVTYLMWGLGLSLVGLAATVLSWLRSGTPRQEILDELKKQAEAKQGKQEKDGQEKDGQQEESEDETDSNESTSGLQQGRLGDCLYTAVNIAIGNAGGNEDAYRQIATQWLLDLARNNPEHNIFQYADVEDLVAVVSQQGEWMGDAGDLSPVVLAYSLGVRLRIVTAGQAYVFNGGQNEITIYYHDNHYTSFPVPDVHGDSPSEVVVAPKKKTSGGKQSESPEKHDEQAGISSGQDIDSGTQETTTTSTSSPNGDEMSSEYAQELRNLLRNLGATAKLTDQDREVMGIIREALREDAISRRDQRAIEKYLANDKKSSSTGFTSGSRTGGSTGTVQPPQGYQRIEQHGQVIYVRNIDLVASNHRQIAESHLVSEQLHRSKNMKGAKVGEPYLHTSKRDSSSLYLLTEDGTHTDGNRMYTILRQGRVSDGMHDFT